MGFEIEREIRMNTRAAKHGWSATALAGLVGSLLLMAVSGTALAQRGGSRGAAPPRAHQHFDGRYSNDRYYYNRGYSVQKPPAGGIGDIRGPNGGRWWFHGGNWYRWNNGLWVVWAPPVGLFVPFLPPYFTTIWLYGVPYYYANDAYYVWDSTRLQYEVVAPPEGIEQNGTTQAPGTDHLFAYPKNGQSAEQQAKDRYECYRWAVSQTGFDPTKAEAGAKPEELAAKRSDYLRAEESCLEGRGYSVK